MQLQNVKDRRIRYNKNINTKQNIKTRFSPQITKFNCQTESPPSVLFLATSI